MFQCTTKYPTDFSDVGLNNIKRFQDDFDVPVGLSDHSGSIYPSLSAITLGASLVEVHMTFNKMCFGPDVSSSLDLEQLTELVQGKRAIHQMLCYPVDKEIQSSKEQELSKTFGKSIAVREDVEAGEILTAGNLTTKKPGFGIPPEQIDSIVGKRALRKISKHRLLREGDFK